MRRAPCYARHHHGLLAVVVTLLTLGVIAAPAAHAQALTAQEKISAYNPEDFTFTIGGPEPDNLVAGHQLRIATLSQLPALDGQGLSMAIVNLDACAINLPHMHPRATEILYLVTGEQLRVAFVEETGGDGSVVNDISTGDVAFFPQGLVHYQQNLGCEPASYVAALNSEDPGIVQITTLIFELPSEALQASLNIDDAQIRALVEALPLAPVLARRDCLARCGLAEDGSPLDDDGKRNLRA